MKRILWLLSLALIACTGTSEPPLPALLALGTGEEVRFLKATPLLEGVAAWTTPGLQDLAFSGRLFLLFSDRVEAYSTQGFSETSVPQELLEAKPLPLDCTGGYLRPGENQLLIACPGDAFTWPLSGGEPSRVDLTGLDPSARLTLGPRDRLAYAAPGVLGHRNPDGSDAQEKSLSTLLPPKDLVYDRDTGWLWALYSDGLESRLFGLSGGLNLTERTFLYGYTRLTLNRNLRLVALGQGFQALDPQGAPLGEAQNPLTRYAAGLAALDGYLYLGREGGGLEVWDLLPTPPQGVASLAFPLSPKAMAFIPIE
ncbi:MAG: hypothetical protein ACUVUP_02080 [Thermaceae bacterium]